MGVSDRRGPGAWAGDSGKRRINDNNINMFIIRLILCLALEFAFGMVHNISCIMPNCWPQSICIVDCHFVLRRSFVLRNEPSFIWIRKLANVAKNSNHVAILLYLHAFFPRQLRYNQFQNSEIDEFYVSGSKIRWSSILCSYEAKITCL